MSLSNPEPFVVTAARRSLTVPIVLTTWAVGVLLSPVIIPGMVISDLVARRRFALTRAMLMVYVYFTWEVLALAHAIGLFLRKRSMTSEQYIARNTKIEGWWARSQFDIAVRLFRIKLEIEGVEELSQGPYLLFIRHVSVIDNLLPAVYGVDRFGIGMRYVINHSLLKDPAIDIIGNRIHCCFVKGGSDDSEKEIERMRIIARGMTRDDGIVCYPEGTLFSPAKRARIIQRLQDGDDPELLEWARRYQHVLPPRLGGTMALLETCPEADVIFCTHAGLEDALTKASIAAGGLIGRPLRIRFWRVPAADRPRDAAGLRRWLFAEWAKVDDWVAKHAVEADVRGD